MLTKSVGNMYSWVSHMHSHIGGKCPHECQYCYVGKGRYGIIPRYEGELRLIDKEFQVNYGSGKIIFIEHMNDMFAEAVPQSFINTILTHCNCYPKNEYVFQTKNPERMVKNLDLMPSKVMLGTTIETNREIMISKAPSPIKRLNGMQKIPLYIKTFVTIEPIMKFDLEVLVGILKLIQPSFVNIGADSKHCNLPEPTKQEVKDLIKAINDAGLTIKIKHNLSRFLN